MNLLATFSGSRYHDPTRRIVTGRLTGAGTVVVGTTGVNAIAGTDAANTPAR